jgi:N-sulfoglucosamine sulfohydrolase
MLILRGPGFTGGRALDELVSHVDVFPTVCELAGIDPPPWLAGRSLVSLAAGVEEPGVRT